MEEIKIIGLAEYEKKIVLALSECKISISRMFLHQVIDSSKYVEDEKVFDFKLLARLVDISRFSYQNEVCCDTFEMDVTGNQLNNLKGWLIAKHDHCNMNRENSEFNLKTFYMLKDMILSIREIMLSERADVSIEKKL